MSHYQSKADRSDVQLKKAGRSSGPGHQRSGGVPSAAVKGGGAGGPGPSGSAPPSSGTPYNSSQSFPAAAASGRPTTPGSSSNRGGKRANGPPGLGRNAQGGGSGDHGGNYRTSHYGGGQFHNQQSANLQPVTIPRQGVGNTDVNQNQPASSGDAEFRHATPPVLPAGNISSSRAAGSGIPLPKPTASNIAAAAPKPPPPAVPSTNTVIMEPTSPVASASSGDAARSAQPAFPLQFGSFSPGFMQVPARTNSAPPNIDDIRREQERFEASRAAGKKAQPIPSGQQLVQITGVTASANEPQPALQSSQNVNSRGLSTIPGNSATQISQAGQSQGMAQTSVPFSQGHPTAVPGRGPQQGQNHVHMPPQHLQHVPMVAGQGQQTAGHGQHPPQTQHQHQHLQQHQPQSHHHHQPPPHQQHAQQHPPQHLQHPQHHPQHPQQHPQQQVLSQQGLVQQNLNPGMKYPPPSMMSMPPGSQIMPQQIGPLTGQLAGHQVPPQLAQQLGSQLTGALGGQLPPGLPGAPYGSPAPNQFIQPQESKSKAVKIVDPHTKQELRFDAKAKKVDSLTEVGTSASNTVPAARVSSNGPQSRQLNYGHPGMVAPPMNFYPQLPGAPYGSGPPPAPYFQQVPKGVATPSGPGVNAPTRYNHGQHIPNQQMRFVNHSGVSPNPPVSKAAGGSAMVGSQGSQSGADMISAVPGPSSASNAAGPPSQPVIPAPAGSSAMANRSVPAVQAGGGGQVNSSNGRAGAVAPISTAASSPAPVITSPGGALKFGDVESSSAEAPVTNGETSMDAVSDTSNPSAGVNGLPLNADSSVASHAPSAGPSEDLVVKKGQSNRGGGNLTAAPSKPAVSVLTSKGAVAPAAAADPSPRSGATPSSGLGEKPKTESSKQLTRELSRKGSKKEQKLPKQHHSQSQLNVAISGDVETTERKGEVPAASTAVLNNQAVAASPGSVASTNVASSRNLQRSQSLLQSGTAATHASNKSVNPSGKSEDSKAASRIEVEQEGRSTGKSSGLSAASLDGPFPSLETDEMGRKTPVSKVNSGKILSSTKSMDGKESTVTESASAVSKSVSSSKQNSLNARDSTAALSREANVVKGGEVPLKKVSGNQTTPLPEALKEGSLNVVETIQMPIVSDLNDVASEPRKGVKIDDSVSKTNATSLQSVLPIAPPVEETLKDNIEPPRPEILDDSKPDTVIDLDIPALEPKDAVTDLSANEAIVDEQAPERGVDAVDQTTGKDILPKEIELGAVSEGLETRFSSNDVTETIDSADTGAANTVTSETSSSVTDELNAPAHAEESVALKDELLDSKAGPQQIENSDVGSGEGTGELGDEGGREYQKWAGKDERSNNPTPLEAASEGSESTKVTSHDLLSPQPATLEVAKNIEPLEKLPNGQVRDGSEVTRATIGRTTSDIQSDNVESTAEQSSKENQESSLGTGNANVEVVQVPSKKKKMKEMLLKADAQGPTLDLFTAYKAPVDKKVAEGKKVEPTSSTNPGIDSKKESTPSSEKVAVKELDDWEDAAELPAPNMASVPSSVSPSLIQLAPAEARSRSDSGIKNFTRDYLLSLQGLDQELPSNFEIRADIAEFVLKKSVAASFVDALPSPGRSLDRQSSGGPRMERRNSNLGLEEDRWTRQGGPLVSPGRGPSDVRMDMGIAGPPGGFRPGQNNAGLVRMPPGIRPVMSPSGMPMGGIHGGLLPHNMMPQGPGRNMGGVDADRWIRAPVPQKGLMPSPRTPLPAMHKTENRYQVGKTSDEEQLKQRQIKSILNKLTPQNFEKLFVQVKEVNIDSASTLTGVISQIFDKALTEPTFCEMYAKFCADLAKELPEFVEGDEKITFKRVLLNKCQEEFQREEREQEEADKAEDGEVKLTKEEREERRVSARKRMLGNIRFIGELFKMNMLTERIMHECIQKLLGEYQNPDEEDVEALCKLMTTIGKMIDYERAKEHIDAYFQRMEMLSENHKLSSRLRFMLKDVIDLRKNGWIVRRKVEGPKKIDEVHRDAVQERQQAASGGLQRMMSGGRRPVGDFPMRGLPSPVFSPGGQMGGKPMGMRGMPSPGAMRGGFGQDVRMEDNRLLMDNRPMVPLTQRPSDEGGLTLGPQGGLGRGMSPRPLGPLGPLGPGRSALADMPPMMNEGPRRPGMGVSGYGGMPDRPPYMGRDDPPMRMPVGDRHVAPLLDKPHPSDRLGPSLSGRDLRGPDRHPVERPGLSGNVNSALRPITPPTPVARPSPATSTQNDAEQLKKKSMSAITEFFSVRDMKEAALCIDELKTPKFHPILVSLWVSEAFEKKDDDRDQLTKLLIYASKERSPPSLTSEQISKGFESVLSTLEDTTVDVPRAPDYVGRMFAKLTVAGVLTLANVGKQLKECGVEPGSLIESGDALNVFGILLDGIRREKGEGSMIDFYKESKLNLEDYLAPLDKPNAGTFEKFLDKNGLQSLYPMIPLEKHLTEAFGRDESAAEILNWVEKSVPETTRSEALFSRIIMTHVLRNSVPLDPGGKPVTPDLDKVLESRIKKFATLLKFSPKHERQYIVAVQLFANDLDHPPGLISALFSKLYEAEVISEGALWKWKDDVKDTTPGRDKAIVATYPFFQWLESAPEEKEDDD